MPAISDLDEAEVVERLGRDVISTLGPEQYFHDTFVDTTWPACPRHPNHPMWFGAGWWLADGRPLVRLGELGSLPK
jgi:hypothetical protein